MPRATYAIPPDPEKRLEFRWGSFMTTVDVFFDHKQVGTSVARESLQQGTLIRLPNGCEITVRVSRFLNAFAPELQVSSEGIALPDSPADPKTRLKSVSRILYVVGGLQIIIGALCVLGDPSALSGVGMGRGALLAGGLLVVFAWLAARGSRFALIGAISLFALDGLSSIWTVSNGNGSFPYAMLIMRIFIIGSLWRGLGAFKSTQAIQ